MRISSSVAAMRRSRKWRLVVALGGAATIASVGISGCNDRLPTDPSPVTPATPSLSGYPTEEEYAQMPSEFRTGPGILRYWVDAGFTASRAWAAAGMDYYATDGTVTVQGTLFRNDRFITSSTGISSESSFLPAHRSLTAYTSMGISGSCGYMVNSHGKFDILNKFLLKSQWLKWGESTRTRDTTAVQPPCTCTEATTLQSSAYDPYSDGDDGSMPCGDSDSGGEGSGIQFKPGDNTGGETVDWTTGKGNGGSSECGAAAVVEYVCLDSWNEEKKQFEEWGCGYVTTCP